MSAFVDSLARHFETAAARLPGSGGALSSHRQAALENFRHSGLPTLRDEDWKYTSLRALERREFALRAVPETPVLARELPDLSGWRAVFVDGHFAAGLSTLDGLPGGVVVKSLAQALDEDGAPVDALLAQEFSGRTEAFAVLNSALMQDGLFLSVPAGVQLDRPLHVVYAGVPGQASLMSHLRNLIHLGDGARAQLIEHWLADGEHANLCNLLGMVTLGREAVLGHTRIQQDSPRGLMVDRLQVEQKAGSRYTAQCADFGGQLVRHDLRVALHEPGACCELHGLYLIDGRTHVDNHTRIDHLAASCTSREEFRGVVGGRGRAVFNGKVVVHPGADGTDASQSNANLLLSDKAEVDTKPELEIYADEVRCSHGATVGQLDTNALFYLRSRGLDEETARGLLTRGFCLSTLAAVEHPPARLFMEELLDAQLASSQGGQG